MFLFDSIPKSWLFFLISINLMFVFPWMLLRDLFFLNSFSLILLSCFFVPYLNSLESLMASMNVLLSSVSWDSSGYILLANISIGSLGFREIILTWSFMLLEYLQQHRGM